MDDLTDDKIRERLLLAWTDPLSLDPTRVSDKVTRQIATNWQNWRSPWKLPDMPRKVSQRS